MSDLGSTGFLSPEFVCTGEVWHHIVCVVGVGEEGGGLQVRGYGEGNRDLIS